MKILKNQKCPKKFPNPRPKFFYPPNTSIRDMAVSMKNLFWSTIYEKKKILIYTFII